MTSQALDEIKIGGLGSSRKRVEDDRFIRGRGNYTDDIVLPGMLHMEILRSPVAHARIVSIDASKAWAYRSQRGGPSAAPARYFSPSATSASRAGLP